jgi:hypothetical protein
MRKELCSSLTQGTIKTQPLVIMVSNKINRILLLPAYLGAF